MQRETIALILTFLIFASGGILYWVNQNKIDYRTQACPQDAKVCSDGSVLTRQLPNCEFLECPPTLSNATSSKAEVIEGLEDLDDSLFKQIEEEEENV